MKSNHVDEEEEFLKAQLYVPTFGEPTFAHSGPRKSRARAVHKSPSCEITFLTFLQSTFVQAALFRGPVVRAPGWLTTRSSSLGT